jgi:hypothetical protein
VKHARLVVALSLAILLALLGNNEAFAIERTFAGSAQLDYHFVPTAKNANADDPSTARQGAGSYTFDGFTVEAALKLAVDLSDHLSANVKVCFGCHGFETDMAYFDYRVADELNFRVGRFSPSFGAFNLRHDVANHKLSDKPLVYDMGRMLRRADWKMGVLPSPFPDNGAEINGTHWFGDDIQLDYAGYAVSGFKAQRDAPELDWITSRSGNAYYVDNNGRPTIGARAALTLKFTQATDLTLGSSGMYGTYDAQNDVWYAILGVDATLRIQGTALRFEYLARRQSFDTTTGQAKWKYIVPAGAQYDYFTKHGGFVELEQPLNSKTDLLLRGDAMFRDGNVQLASPLISQRSSIYRATLGMSYAIEQNLRFKASTEYWTFSDNDFRGHDKEVTFHVAGVATF